eukprot:COSAG01_NODE_81_length_27820_cov_22.659753_25_plen_204_part_00
MASFGSAVQHRTSKPPRLVTREYAFGSSVPSKRIPAAAEAHPSPPLFRAALRCEATKNPGSRVPRAASSAQMRQAAQEHATTWAARAAKARSASSPDQTFAKCKTDRDGGQSYKRWRRRFRASNSAQTPPRSCAGDYHFVEDSEVTRRLRAAGAKRGVLACALMWTGDNDIDLVSRIAKGLVASPSHCQAINSQLILSRPPCA